MRVLALVALAACGPGDPDCVTFVGDRTQAPAMDVVALGADGTSAVLAGGGAIQLIKPTQGGRVLLAGLRARNVCTGTIEVDAALIDPCNGHVAGLEGRSVQFVSAGGYAVAAEPTQLSSYANVAVCPNNIGDRDIEDQAYRLTVSLKDGLGRVASATIDVTPVCAEPVEECRCICAAGYVLGQPCGPLPDAGVQSCP
jgi:hypothetical protein